MEIISRADARAKSLKTYFTGTACKNGHTAYRYVQSGTCSQCIRDCNGASFDPNAQARKDAKSQLVQVRIRVVDADRDALALAVWAAAVVRFPVLTQGDVDPHLLPTDRSGGTGLYSFNCHVDDVAALRKLADDMRRARPSLLEIENAARLKRIAESMVEPPPPWSERP